jgi:hypothetical protein
MKEICTTMKRTTFAILLSLGFTHPVWAYKEQIHRVMSLKAFDRMTADLQGHLGITKDDSVGGDSLRVMVGQAAYDEDGGNNSLNHFYDPEHDAALSVPFTLCIPVGATARNWGVDGLGQNSFSTAEARLYYEAVLMAPNDSVRDVNLKLLFQSLGHSIHLVQDMAQPEHTRNDQHLPGSEVLLGNGTEASLYEEWGLQNLLGLYPAVPYDGYPSVALPTAFDYFSTNDRRGLAQFANNSFVTQDTNYDDEQVFGHCHYYVLPVLPTEQRVEVVNEAVKDAFGGVTVMPIMEKIYTSHPADNYTGATETDPDHTFLSSLDLETRFLTGPKFSLADASYQTRAGMLIPRAVGYSAGYLDHFFRGKIDALWKKNPAGGGYDIKITNLSSEAIGPDVYIEALYAPGASYTGLGTNIAMVLNDYLSQYVGGFAGIPAGGSVTIPNAAIPYLHPGDDVNAFERRIVIRGKLGAEDFDMIGLLQPGRPKKLRIEVDWPTADPMLAEGFYIGDTVNNQWDVTWSAPSNCGTWTRLQIPNSTMSPLASKPMIFTVDPLPPNVKYLVEIAHNSCYPAVSAPQNTTIRVYGDDKLLSSETVFLDSYIIRYYP